MGKKLKYLVNSQDYHQRLDIYLANKEASLSRSFVQKMIKEGQVKVNQEQIKPSYLLKAGDQIDVVIPPPTPLSVVPQKVDFAIVFEDPYLLVINKPADLVVHPAPGHRDQTLVNGLLYHCQDLQQIGGKIRPGIVHRLDQETSGVMVVAKEEKTHQHLIEQFKLRTIGKRYLALVGPFPYPEQGEIDSPIGRHPFHRKKMAVNLQKGRPAKTKFSVLARSKQGTLLLIKPLTGRTHQIRVHLQQLNSPIIGDKVYGKKYNDFEVPRQMLHALSLTFRHPILDQELFFEVMPPLDFIQTMEAFALKWADIKLKL